MSWDPSLGDIFTSGVTNIVTSLSAITAVLKDILVELQAVGKKIK